MRGGGAGAAAWGLQAAAPWRERLVASVPRRCLCLPGRYYGYMFGQSRWRKRGRRPLGARAEPELLELQVVLESPDPGCHSYPHLTASEACEYRPQPGPASALLPRLTRHRQPPFPRRVPGVTVSRLFS